MSRHGWKAVERSAAALMSARRFPANSGFRDDFEGEVWIGQVKNVKVLSLAALEALALEQERRGVQKAKLGAVVVKRSAGRGTATPHLVVLTETTFRELCGRLPSEDGRAEGVPHEGTEEATG